MRNIELKARVRDLEEARRICRVLGAEAKGEIHQVDTYFAVGQGRLKLREAVPGGDELVFYRRPDVSGPKGCDYLLEPVNRSIKAFLAGALGISAVVEKKRGLYLWRNVRIHLDRVAGLGDFIEFEAVLSEEQDDADGYRKLDSLIEAFHLTPEDYCETSYLEMMPSAQT